MLCGVHCTFSSRKFALHMDFTLVLLMMSGKTLASCLLDV